MGEPHYDSASPPITCFLAIPQSRFRPSRRILQQPAIGIEERMRSVEIADRHETTPKSAVVDLGTYAADLG
jgi:hypothetical protein